MFLVQYTFMYQCLCIWSVNKHCPLFLQDKFLPQTLNIGNTHVAPITKRNGVHPVLHLFLFIYSPILTHSEDQLNWIWMTPTHRQSSIIHYWVYVKHLLSVQKVVQQVNHEWSQWYGIHQHQPHPNPHMKYTTSLL